MQFKTITNNAKFTSTDIAKVIDDHFMNETCFLFVCDKQLAEFINNYVMDIYDVNNKYDEYNYDNEESLKDNLEQYYVSVYFSNDEDSSAIFFVESAKGISDVYKFHDNEDEYIDFYICVNIDEEVVFDRLVGENATWYWLSVDMGDIEEINEYNECNDCECDGCCEKCDVKDVEDVVCEDDCNLCEEIRLIEDFADKIEEIVEIGCDTCLRNMLYELYVIGKNIGFSDHRDMIREMIDKDEDC